jgi:hypothetical protein
MRLKKRRAPPHKGNGALNGCLSATTDKPFYHRSPEKINGRVGELGLNELSAEAKSWSDAAFKGVDVLGDTAVQREYIQLARGLFQVHRALDPDHPPKMLLARVNEAREGVLRVRRYLHRTWRHAMRNRAVAYALRRLDQFDFALDMIEAALRASAPVARPLLDDGGRTWA